MSTDEREAILDNQLQLLSECSKKVANTNGFDSHAAAALQALSDAMVNVRQTMRDYSPPLC